MQTVGSSSSRRSQHSSLSVAFSFSALLGDLQSHGVTGEFHSSDS